jgi:hypothetical protein
LVEFSDGLFFFNGLKFIKFNLTLGTFFESTNEFSSFRVIVEGISKGSS